MGAFESTSATHKSRPQAESGRNTSSSLTFRNYVLVCDERGNKRYVSPEEAQLRKIRDKLSSSQSVKNFADEDKYVLALDFPLSGKAPLRRYSYPYSKLDFHTVPLIYNDNTNIVTKGSMKNSNLKSIFLSKTKNPKPQKSVSILDTKSDPDEDAKIKESVLTRAFFKTKSEPKSTAKKEKSTDKAKDNHDDDNDDNDDDDDNDDGDQKNVQNGQHRVLKFLSTKTDKDKVKKNEEKNRKSNNSLKQSKNEFPLENTEAQEQLLETSEVSPAKPKPPKKSNSNSKLLKFFLGNSAEKEQKNETSLEISENSKESIDLEIDPKAKNDFSDLENFHSQSPNNKVTDEVVTQENLDGSLENENNTQVNDEKNNKNFYANLKSLLFDSPKKPKKRSSMPEGKTKKIKDSFTVGDELPTDNLHQSDDELHQKSTFSRIFNKKSAQKLEKSNFERRHSEPSSSTNSSLDGKPNKDKKFQILFYRRSHKENERASKDRQSLKNTIVLIPSPKNENLSIDNDHANALQPKLMKNKKNKRKIDDNDNDNDGNDNDNDNDNDVHQSDSDSVESVESSDKKSSKKENMSFKPMLRVFKRKKSTKNAFSDSEVATVERPEVANGETNLSGKSSTKRNTSKNEKSSFFNKFFKDKDTSNQTDVPAPSQENSPAQEELSKEENLDASSSKKEEKKSFYSHLMSILFDPPKQKKPPKRRSSMSDDLNKISNPDNEKRNTRFWSSFGDISKKKLSSKDSEIAQERPKSNSKPKDDSKNAIFSDRRHSETSQSSSELPKVPQIGKWGPKMRKSNESLEKLDAELVNSGEVILVSYKTYDDIVKSEPSDTESADHGSTDKSSITKLTSKKIPKFNFFDLKLRKPKDSKVAVDIEETTEAAENAVLEKISATQDGVVYAELDITRGNDNSAMVRRENDDKTEYAEIMIPNLAKNAAIKKSRDDLRKSQENLAGSRENLTEPDVVVTPEGKKEAAV